VDRCFLRTRSRCIPQLGHLFTCASSVTRLANAATGSSTEFLEVKPGRRASSSDCRGRGARKDRLKGLFKAFSITPRASASTGLILLILRRWGILILVAARFVVLIDIFRNSSYRGAAMRFARLLLTLLLLVSAGFSTEPEGVPEGSKFILHISRVRSLATKPIGFSRHALPTYSVDAEGNGKLYSLACIDRTPEAGTSPTALVFYATSSYSFLHLWPVNRQAMALPTGMKKKGQLFKVLLIDQSDGYALSCDIAQERAPEEPK
jgi:hypothetical protein